MAVGVLSKVTDHTKKGTFGEGAFLCVLTTH